jgi:hypothetical protein
MSAGFLSQPADGFAVHLRQPRRLPNAASFIEVFQDRQTGLGSKLRPEQAGATAFAEAFSAGFATEQSSAIPAVVGTNIKIAGVAFAVKTADGIQTTEA